MDRIGTASRPPCSHLTIIAAEKYGNYAYLKELLVLFDSLVLANVPANHHHNNDSDS
jgi:hypothetical protein